MLSRDEYVQEVEMFQWIFRQTTPRRFSIEVRVRYLSILGLGLTNDCDYSPHICRKDSTFYKQFGLTLVLLATSKSHHNASERVHRALSKPPWQEVELSQTPNPSYP